MENWRDAMVQAFMMSNPQQMQPGMMEQMTQPIRDFSDASGNTQFWRGVAGGEYPGLAAAAQFVGRAPVKGTQAYDQAMARVLNRGEGMPSVKAAPPRAADGVRPAQYSNYTAGTNGNMPANDRGGPVSAYDQAAFNQLLRRQMAEQFLRPVQ